MKRSKVQQARVAVLSTLALSIQPVQYTLLILATQAFTSMAQAQTDDCGPVVARMRPTDVPKGQASTPDYECEPQVGGGGGSGGGIPGGNNQPKPVSYLLLPGIGDNTPEPATRTNYFDQYGQGLMNYLQASHTSATVTPLYAQWRSQSITVQGGVLAQQIVQQTDQNRRVILVGHSMGGLRGRDALQNHRVGTMDADVVGLVTLGTPNAGAPIIDKGPNAATYLGAVFGVSLGGFGGPTGAFVGSVAGMFGARYLATSITNTPSGNDLRPSSSFIQQLNNPSPANRLPSTLPVLTVLGENNEVDSLGASYGLSATASEVAATRKNAGSVLAFASALAFGAAFFTFGATIPIAIMFLVAANLLFNLPTFWKEKVVGDQFGDTVVPRSSQFLPANVGGGVARVIHLEQSVHVGRYTEYQASDQPDYTDARKLREGIKDLQTLSNVPLSP